MLFKVNFMTFERFAAILFLWVSMTVPSVWAQTYTVLYTFKGGSDGLYPSAALLQDSEGNLYGTTAGAAAKNRGGTVFKVSSTGEFTLLHNFGAAGPTTQINTPLVRDSSGNLYGTTGEEAPSNNWGTVFKLDIDHHFSTFFKFPNGEGGRNLYGIDLTIDSADNLYGAAAGGDGKSCPQGCGLIFKLDPNANETILHTFSNGVKGTDPSGPLLLDASGNLYGTTLGQVDAKGSVAFELDPAGTETVLGSFRRQYSSVPAFPQGVIRDGAGNFYGTLRGRVL
jgi:uncharacterized repeat protein (TIGR03803 family)